MSDDEQTRQAAKSAAIWGGTAKHDRAQRERVEDTQSRATAQQRNSPGKLAGAMRDYDYSKIKQLPLTALAERSGWFHTITVARMFPKSDRFMSEGAPKWVTEKTHSCWCSA